MATKDRSVYFAARYMGERATFNPKFYQFGLTHRIVRTRTGTVNPNWKQNISDHVNATTPLTGVYMTLNARQGNGSAQTKFGKFSWVGDLAAETEPAPIASVSSTVQAHERAVQRFLKQLRAAQVKMSGQVFIGELHQALHMLRHPAEGLLKAMKETYLDKLKRIKNKDPRRWQRAISQTWLEATFGWRPFVSDLEDAGKAYQEICQKAENRFVPLRAVGKSNPTLVEAFAGNQSFPPGTSMVQWKTRKTWDNAVCVIRGEAKASANTTWLDKARIFGLSPSEFIPTAWELLPWSFLVDYFTNVGDILENSITDVSNLAWACESKVKIRHLDIMMCQNVSQTAANYGVNYISGDAGSPSTAFWQHRSVQRSVGTDLSVPPLRFELPGNPIQQLNIVALWAQAYYGLHQQKGIRR